VTQREIDWAYAVLEALKEGLDKVAVNPALNRRFTFEFLVNLPDIFEAFIVLVKDEHREMVGSVVSSAVAVVRAGVRS